MKIRSALFLVLVPAALALAPTGDKIALQPSDGTSVTKKFQIENDISLEDLSLEINGNDVSAMAGNVEITMKVSQQVEVTDTYATVANGRPTKLVRSYDELSSTSHVSTSSPQMDVAQEKDMPLASELEGAKVAFTWNDSGESYDVAFAEGADGDKELLDNLSENMDLRGFLPTAEVASGATWEIPVEAVQAALAPGGDLKLKPESESDGEGMSGMESFSAFDMIKELEGKFTAEYAGTREEEGAQVAVIKVKLDGKSAQDMGDRADQMKQAIPGVEMDISALDSEFTCELEGELLWDLQAGLPRGLHLSGEMRMIIDISMSMGSTEGNQSVEMSQTYSGTQTLTMTVGE